MSNTSLQKIPPRPTLTMISPTLAPDLLKGLRSLCPIAVPIPLSFGPSRKFPPAKVSSSPLQASVTPCKNLSKSVTSSEGGASTAASKATKLSYATDVPRFAHLKEWFGNRPAEALAPLEIEDTLCKVATAECWAASTFNHYRSLVSLAYRLAIRNRKTTVNPARSVSRRREDNSRVRYLTEDEEKRFRVVLELEYQWHLPEFDLALNTGLRQGSQYSLTWSMVDWKERMVHVPRTKNEQPLHVPLNEAALAALRIAQSRNGTNGRVFVSERTGEPLEHPRHWFAPALRKAKIAGFHWHDLRHTFASRLRMKGTPLEDIADLLGHKSLMMTRRYAHLGPNHLHETVARLGKPAVNPAPVQNGSQPDRRQHYVN